MKTITSLFIILPCIAFSQIKMYKTYNHYKNNKPEEVYKDFTKGIMDNTSKLIVYDQNGERTKIPVHYWGFEYKGMLFRIAYKGSLGGYREPVLVVSTGKICYYENGFAHLDAIINNAKKPYVPDPDERFYFSETLTSEVTENCCASIPQPYEMITFLRKPEYKELYNCLLQEKPEYLHPTGKNAEKIYQATKWSLGWSEVGKYVAYYLDIEIVRKCVKAFNNDSAQFPTIIIK